MNVGVFAAVEIVEDPCVNRTERQAAFIVRSSSRFNVVKQPSELYGGRIGRQRKSTYVQQVISAFAILQLSDQTLGPGVWPTSPLLISTRIKRSTLETVYLPGYCVIQWLASLRVPNHRRLALVGDSNGFDIGDVVTLVQEDVGRPVYALLYR